MIKHFKIKSVLLIVLIFSLFLFSSLSSAQEDVNLSLRRTFGMAFGSNIQGTFTAVGSGTENIVNLSLQFDNVEVAFSGSNSLSFKFKTKEYEPGELNITLLGYDTEGILYSTTKLVKIMTPTVSYIITISIILVVVILASVKYGPRIKRYFQMKKDNNRKDDPVSEE